MSKADIEKILNEVFVKVFGDKRLENDWFSSGETSWEEYYDEEE